MQSDSYCIDSSSLIKLKQDYPRKTFPPVWDRIEGLIEEGRLFAPLEVFKEIEKDDVLGPWCKKRKQKLFRALDSTQWAVAKQIADKFPQLAKSGKFGPAADPFVVALAKIETEKSGSLFPGKNKCLVVTEEGGGPQQIPAACKASGVQTITLVELFANEGWVFR